jgi:hypothetical protein
VIRDVDRGVNLFKADEIAFNPITESKIFDINMACSASRVLVLGITHGSTAIVIFVCNVDGCGFLRNIEVPEHTAYK